MKRKSHGRANSPPDGLLGPAVRIHPPNTHNHKEDQSERIDLLCGMSELNVYFVDKVKYFPYGKCEIMTCGHCEILLLLVAM